MSSLLLAPSVIAADFGHLAEEIQWVNQSATDLLHIDLMDGHFVPNIALGFEALDFIASHSQKPLDYHLMLSCPESFLTRCVKLGAETISVHLEACTHLLKVLEQIKTLGCRAGVAINPHTPLCLLDELWGVMDVLVIMSVHPGFSRQYFLPQSVQKVAAAREIRAKKRSHAQIEVDGGVNLQIAPQLVDAGADILVTGHALFSSEDRDSWVKAMKHL